MKNILLYTSGLDSFIAKRYLEKERHINDLILVYFDLGHKYAHIERELIEKTQPDCKIIELNDIGIDLEDKDAYIPNRNALLVLLADAYIHHNENKNIYIGGLADDNIIDNNITFTKNASKLLSYGKRNINVETAFNDYSMTKSDIVRWYSKHFNAENLISNTYSCFDDKKSYENQNVNDQHCYNCKACFRRNTALQDIKVLPFYNDDIIKEYKDNLKNYEKTRQKRIISYLKKINKF